MFIHLFQFLKIIYTVTGKDIEPFIDLWVYPFYPSDQVMCNESWDSTLSVTPHVPNKLPYVELQVSG